MAETRPQHLKPLDVFLPSYEFAARYGVTVEADAGEAERAVRARKQVLRAAKRRAERAEGAA